MSLFSHNLIQFCSAFLLQYIMIEEPNGNGIVNMKLSPSASIPITSSPSNDDLSQSLSTSEYTDADDSMSAPTEYLAEVNMVMRVGGDDDNKDLFGWARFSFLMANSDFRLEHKVQRSMYPYVSRVTVYRRADLCGKFNSRLP